MNDARLNELRQKYKDRNLLEELGWGAYANHSGYTSKSNGEFLNWLCNEAYRELKKTQPEQRTGKWIHVSEEMWKCDQCGEISCCSPNFCPDCGADMREVTE